MKSLAMRLEEVISGKTFDSTVLGEAKLHLTSDSQFDSIERYLSGTATTDDWRELQDLVIEIRKKELLTVAS